MHRFIRPSTAARPPARHLPTLLGARNATFLLTLNVAKLSARDPPNLYRLTRVIRHRVGRKIIDAAIDAEPTDRFALWRLPFESDVDLEVVNRLTVAL